MGAHTILRPGSPFSSNTGWFDKVASSLRAWVVNCLLRTTEYCKWSTGITKIVFGNGAQECSKLVIRAL